MGTLWLTNPHNPTGQLWSRSSLERAGSLRAGICDEAFFLVPGGAAIAAALGGTHPNLVVIRSLTKLLAVAGLRLGYAVVAADRLQRWQRWRDPWPVNGLALAAGEAASPIGGAETLVAASGGLVADEGSWLQHQLMQLPGITPMPSSTNSLDPRDTSLVELRERVARRGVLLRDCRRSGLGERWLRIGLQNRRGNRRILRALAAELG